MTMKTTLTSLCKTLILLVCLLTAVVASAQNADNDSIRNHKEIERPVVTPYFLQHQYLSVIAPMVAEEDSAVFATPDFLNTGFAAENGFKSPFRDDEIVVETIECEGKNVYVWRFPDPEYLREALYIAFFPVDGKYQAYAISIGQLVDWEISVSTSSSRRTFGRVKHPDNAAECVELLKNRGAFTGEISPGVFIQDGYKGPEYR